MVKRLLRCTQPLAHSRFTVIQACDNRDLDYFDFLVPVDGTIFVKRHLLSVIYTLSRQCIMMDTLTIWHAANTNQAIYC